MTGEEVLREELDKPKAALMPDTSPMLQWRLRGDALSD